jgi:serine/threonine protein kinase
MTRRASDRHAHAWRPSRWWGCRRDGRADVRLGCVLYEMLAGQPPFTGSRLSLVYQHISVEPRPVTSTAEVPAGVTAAIATALASFPPTAIRQRSGSPLVLPATSATTPVPHLAHREHPHTRSRARGSSGANGSAECTRLFGDAAAHPHRHRRCGKPGCAEAGRDLMARFVDGAWFRTSRPQDADRVTLTLATVLGLRETADACFSRP